MEKTLNERLFDQLMRAPHALRKSAIEDDMPHGPEHGPEGHHGHGPEHGPEGHHGHGPEHGPEGHHGHGPEHGPEGHHGHGPGHDHGRRPGAGLGRERILRVIGSYEEGVRQKTLTEELRINPSSVSEMISKLENDGYVKRTVDPTDKRATLITLTELGEARNAEIQDDRNDRLERAFSSLTDEEKEQLITLLEKITDER